MTRLYIALALAAALAAGCASSERRWKPAVYLQTGARELESGDFQGADGLPTLGLEAVGWVEGWPVQPEVGIVGSEDSGSGSAGGTPTELDGRVLELYAGVRKQWKWGLLWPYVGGGLSVVDARLEQQPVGLPASVDSQTSLGAYGRIGLDLMITRRFSIGVDGRYLIGSELEVAGQRTNVDGLVGTLRFGWAF